MQILTAHLTTASYNQTKFGMSTQSFGRPKWSTSNNWWTPKIEFINFQIMWNILIQIYIMHRILLKSIMVSDNSVLNAVKPYTRKSVKSRQRASASSITILLYNTAMLLAFLISSSQQQESHYYVGAWHKNGVVHDSIEHGW